MLLAVDPGVTASLLLVIGRCKKSALHVMYLGNGVVGYREHSPKRAAGLDRYKMTGETGSYRYMAPEVFKSEPCKTFSGPFLMDTERAAFCTLLCVVPLLSLMASCGADNAKVDVYAFSMILFELLEGEHGDALSAFFCLPAASAFHLHGMVRWISSASLSLCRLHSIPEHAPS